MESHIREATDSDKALILKFCQNTFSWGDYIENVWDSWLAEGNLFVAQKESPIGVCHAFYSDTQVWIEGIRVDPNLCHQGIATSLIKHAESVGEEKNISESFMLIDTQNSTSLLMANSLNYTILQTWNYYSLESRANSNYNVTFNKSVDKRCTHYVKSWRWLPLHDDTITSLHNQNCIVQSSINGETSLAIIAESDHFGKTLLVTLLSGSDDSVSEILYYVQNLGAKKGYERIQILTQQRLPDIPTIQCRIAFHLMKKSLF